MLENKIENLTTAILGLTKVLSDISGVAGLDVSTLTSDVKNESQESPTEAEPKKRTRRTKTEIEKEAEEVEKTKKAQAQAKVEDLEEDEEEVEEPRNGKIKNPTYDEIIALTKVKQAEGVARDTIRDKVASIAGKEGSTISHLTQVQKNELYNWLYDLKVGAVAEESDEL